MKKDIVLSLILAAIIVISLFIFFAGKVNIDLGGQEKNIDSQTDKKVPSQPAGQTATSAGTEEIPFNGIIDGKEVPAPYHSGQFKVINYWGGELNGKMIGVYAGYDPKDPNRGGIAILDDPDNVLGDFYFAPQPSGPLEIISVASGILNLQTPIGSYEIYDQPREFIKVESPTTYLFDLVNKSFK